MNGLLVLLLIVTFYFITLANGNCNKNSHFFRFRGSAVCSSTDKSYPGWKRADTTTSAILIWFIFNSQLYKYSIFNNYWTRLRKISLSGRHWQITIFCDNHSSIIVLSFDHQVWFLMNVLKETKQSAIFREKSDRKKEKSVVLCRIFFSAKHSWTTLRMRLEQTIICMSRGGLSTGEKKENLPWMNKNVVCYKYAGILFFINFDLQFSLCARIWFS